MACGRERLEQTREDERGCCQVSVMTAIAELACGHGLGAESKMQKSFRWGKAWLDGTINAG